MIPARSPRATQGGVVVFMIALLLAIASAVVLVQSGRMSATLEPSQSNAESLRQVKEALVAYAVTQVVVPNPLLPAVVPSRPGELPCPDADGDGFEDAACAAGAVGRVPWKTLGINQPKDSTGEPLWYAVSGPFRRSPMGAAQINSDTTGDLVVYGPAANVITNKGAAVVIAPGSAVAGQVRTSSPPLATNYLDAYQNDVGTVIGNNALAAGPFIVAARKTSFNDEVSVLNTGDLIPRVEARVANEIRSILDKYQTNSELGTMPWAVSFSSPLSTVTSQVGVNRGRLPLVALPDDWGTLTPSGRRLPSLPTWFTANGWREFVYYTFSGFLMLSQGGCSTCTSNFISLGSTSGILGMVFTPGTSLVGARTPTNLADYLESNDAADDQYVIPPYQRLDQDHVVALPTLPRQQCAGVANELSNLAPCGQPSRINGTCLRLATQLQACSCGSAALQLITTPCENNLSANTCLQAKNTVGTCQ